MKDTPTKTKLRRTLKVSDAPPEIFKFTKEGEEIEGVFEGIVESDVSDDKTIKNAVIKLDDGNRIQLALNSTLSYHFQTIRPGMPMRLTWLGKKAFKHPKMGDVMRNEYTFES